MLQMCKVRLGRDSGFSEVRLSFILLTCYSRESGDNQARSSSAISDVYVSHSTPGLGTAYAPEEEGEPGCVSRQRQGQSLRSGERCRGIYLSFCCRNHQGDIGSC